MLVMIALLIQWQHSDTRQARRFDRREDRNDDAELKLYNAMLAQMNTPGRAAEEPADRAVDDAAAPAGRD